MDYWFRSRDKFTTGFLEVLRGCTRGAVFVRREWLPDPYERTIDNIETLMERITATGCEEVSLVSLSTCDYSKVRTMVQKSENTKEQWLGYRCPLCV